MSPQGLTLSSLVALFLVICVFVCGLPAFDLDGEDVHTYGHGDRAVMPLHFLLACIALLLPSAVLIPKPRCQLLIGRLEAVIVGNQSSCQLCPNTYPRPAPPPAISL
jgi:hypothetical protein